MSSAYVVPAGCSKDNLAVLTAAAAMLVLDLAAPLRLGRSEAFGRDARLVERHRKLEPYRNTLRTAVEAAIERADAETRVVGNSVHFWGTQA